MRAHSSIRVTRKPFRLEISLSPIWIAALVAVSLGIIYVVGLEPMPFVHNAFHDLRHATGFPCH